MALGIAATMVSQALPALSALMNAQRTNAIAYGLATDLREARHAAIHSNRTIELSFGAKGNTQCYVVFTGSGTCTCSGSRPVCDPSTTVLKTVSIGDQARLTFWNNRQRLAFSAGQGLGPMASLGVVDSKGEGVKHIVAVTGRIRSCSTSTSRGGLPKC